MSSQKGHDNTEQTPMDKFRSLAEKLFSVPKDELDTQQEEPPRVSKRRGPRKKDS